MILGQNADYLKLEQRKGFSLDMQLEYLVDLIVIGQFIMLNDKDGSARESSEKLL